MVAPQLHWSSFFLDTGPTIRQAQPRLSVPCHAKWWREGLEATGAVGEKEAVAGEDEGEDRDGKEGEHSHLGDLELSAEDFEPLELRLGVGRIPQGRVRPHGPARTPPTGSATFPFIRMLKMYLLRTLLRCVKVSKVCLPL